jgi:DNA-binding NarL/FixJ family response regulator
VALLASGDTWKMAAFKMQITESGIRFHVQNIFLKMQAHSTLAALVKLLS